MAVDCEQFWELADTVKRTALCGRADLHHPDDYVPRPWMDFKPYEQELLCRAISDLPPNWDARNEW